MAARGSAAVRSSSFEPASALRAAARPAPCALRDNGRTFAPGTEREGHRALDDDLAVDAGDPAQLTHPASQPAHGRFDLDDVPRVHGAAIANPLDPHEVDQLLAILGLRENHDRADLRDRLGE